jgi:F-type H+-transporting ATPase subunit b
MNEVAHTEHATVGVPPKHGAEGTPNVMEVSATMMWWTWGIFTLVAIILYKLAWKPILGALEKREETIRQSLDNAAKLRDELDKLDQQRRDVLTEAERQSRDVLTEARKVAGVTANAIEQKAHAAAQGLVENAKREIQAAEEKAKAALRQETAELALAAASRLLQENLDDAKNRALTDQLIQKLG